ncbi:MAG: M28 family peptidase [Flavobacteriaceae bacterium]
MKKITFLITFLIVGITQAQTDTRVYDIINNVSAERIKNDITKLANFGTRHTLSDTVSQTRGIGAARRWIKSEFDKISSDCKNCLNVFYQQDLVKADKRRIVHDVMVVNVVALQKGTKYPNRYIIMSGDIDSRVSNANNFTSDSPGANDNASGMAGTIEAARVLSKYQFENSIIYVGLSGEEQGLFGGRGLAAYAKEKGWEIVGIMNNDMIGNIKGVDGVIDNRTFRIFSEPNTYEKHTDRQRVMRRFYGGEVDGTSRQLARFIHKTVKTYMPEMNPKMIYRLDRFGRGGHHRPFNDAGYPGIRIMEMHENYTQQHQDIRTENGIEYGDKIKFVNFEYAKKLTAVNAINLASIAWAPPAPKNVKIGGAVRPAVKLIWNKVDGAKGYKVYWRDTTSPTWDHYKYVEGTLGTTLEGIVVDNFFFGVAAVGENGHESIVTFPSGILRN